MSADEMSTSSLNGSGPAVRPRVLIFGSFAPPGIPCGVTNAVRNFVASPIRERYELKLVSTYREPDEQRGLASLLAFGIWLGIRSLVHILQVRPRLVDVHAVSNRDFRKHAAVVLAARLLRRPCVLRLHGGDFDRVYAAAGRTSRTLIRWTLRLPSQIVVLSEGWIRIVRSIEPCARVCAIPNAVDCDAYSELGARRAINARNVLLLGNLCERKGHFDALEAAARVLPAHPEVTFAFAGAERDPGTRMLLEQKVDELALDHRVCFLGPIFGAEKIEALSRAAVFISPSHTENMPLSVAEAMAAALPVVVTNVGATPDMIEDGVTGFLIPPRDPKALAYRIGALLGNPALRQEMGLRAQNVARQRWDVRVVARANAELYEKLMGSHSAGTC